MSDTNELLRSKHAFGMEENIDSALEQGLVDAFDILFLKDKDGNPKIGWIDKEGKKVIVEAGEDNVIPVKALPEAGEEGKIYIFGEDGYFWNGTEFVNLCKPTDLTDLEKDVDALESEVASKADAKETECSYKKIKYEISHKPEGTLVDYRDKEIRVMCPVDTKWVKQSVGGTGNSNMYYMGFKAYAPEGAVSFKEGDRGVIVDEMFTFDSEFAGTDEFGRNYSICWLALASYDDSTEKWTYFGKNSSTSKYIGWTYIVEWYNSDGIIIESDCIRINLSNEECHYSIEPSYINSTIEEIDTKIEKIDAKIEEATTESKTYTDEQIASIMSAYAVVEF